MNRIAYEIHLKSEGRYGKCAPPEPVGRLISLIPLLARRSVRMAVEGRSAGNGSRRPGWLERAADVRLCDYSGHDDTVFQFEAPALGEAAEELYAQQELWQTKPSPTQTAMDLLRNMAADIVARNEDSVLFDRRLLSEFSTLHHTIDEFYHEVDFMGRAGMAEAPVVVDREALRAARDMQSRTPDPQQARVAGILDMVKASTQAFALKLAEGEQLQGVLTGDDLREYRELLGMPVLVAGRCVFRASGKPLRMEAEIMQPAAESDSLWSHLPKARTSMGAVPNFRRPQGPKSGLSAILGRWPGEESEDELVRALQELS